MLSAHHLLGKPGLKHHVDALFSCSTRAPLANMTHREHHVDSIACLIAE